MMADEKLMTLEVSAEGDRLKTDAKARQHLLTFDEPEELGGTDVGASPLENVLGALAGCVNVVVNVVAKEMDFDLEHISFQVEGDFNPEGFMGVEGVRPYFSQIRMKVFVVTTESEARLKELQETTDKRCPMLTMLEAANVEIQSEWRIR